MVATKVRQPKTYEDYLATPDDGQRYELIDGEIVVSPSASKRHQIISMRLSSWLFFHTDTNALGQVLAAPMDVRLDRDLVVQPDILFIRAGSPADDPAELRVAGPPNLAVEILSPSTAVRDLNRKREIYEQYGVEEYWIIDPDRKTVTAYELGDSGYTLIRQRGGRLTSSAVPGYVLEVKRLFDGVM
jgi:Uma2 family endonuclease